MRKEESKTRTDDTMEDLQAESIRLQRQFRLLEDDRRCYKEETEYALRKQRETIQSLQLEHEELAKEYKLAISKKNQNSDADNTSVLRQLLDEEDESKKAVVTQSAKVQKVNEQITNLLKKVDSQRKLMGGCKESERCCKAMINLNRVMENRLNEANVKFNTALSQNRELRDEIGHINAQRRRFHDLHKKLSKMFRVGKNEKNFLIQNATSLFNSREEAQHRMQCLRERSERDMTTFNSELKDLLRVIDHDRKLREFMDAKMEERSELYEASVKYRNEKKLFDHIKSLQAEVGHYESIFEQLKEVSHIQEIDEMVNKYINVEDQNFAMFIFVQDQNQSIQQKETSIKELKQRIKTMREEEVVVEKKRQTILKDLEEKLGKQENENTLISNLLKEDASTIENICKAFNQTMDRIQCDPSPLKDLLGGTTICAENVTSYLGLIEQRASELIQAQSFVLHKIHVEEQRLLNLVTFSVAARVATFVTQVRPPPMITETNEPTSQDGVRPMSQSEVRKRAANVVKIERLADFLKKN